MSSVAPETEILFNLERIYVKDLSFESPAAPQAFLEKTAPEVSVQLGIEHSTVAPGEGLHEVVLQVTVTATQGSKTIFLAESKQAGLFRIQGVPEGEMEKVLEITCPSILLPFVREVINGLVERGGFPQLLINPINFEALYQQKHEDAQRAH
ncbi:MAG TPA: protein-export chaperone SecB [Acidiferrobacteraceae bacterium]|nr:protein-export chaperone SecB [Acidiferrobacteraceae bacterium]